MKDIICDKIMNYEFDTITAISTPFGTGGVGVIRISGDNAFEIILAADDVVNPILGSERIAFLAAEIEMVEKSNRTAQEVNDILLSMLKNTKVQSIENEITKKIKIKIIII